MAWQLNTAVALIAKSRRMMAAGRQTEMRRKIRLLLLLLLLLLLILLSLVLIKCAVSDLAGE